MKSIKIIALGIAFFSYAAIASAETVTVTATATATATIITPITITKMVDLSFGSILPGTGGTITIGPEGSRTVTGGITVPPSSPAPTAASFTISGMAGTNFTITIPQTITLMNAGNPMIVTITQLGQNSGTLSTAGTQTISIGATLAVAANQAPGIYTSASELTVTVNMQ